MMNFRYHIVSLIAVFLALGIGIITGATVVDEGVVSVLKRLNNARSATVSTLREQVDSASRELALWEGVGDSLFPPLAKGLLTGKRILFVASADVKQDELELIERAVTDAGGGSAGRISFTDRWQLKDEATREQLGLAIRSRATGIGALQRDAAAAISLRLRAPADLSAEDDLLRSLSENDLLDIASPLGTSFPPAGAGVLYIASGSSEPVPSAADFGLPFARVLSGSVPFTIAEPLGAKDSLVDRARDDADLLKHVATIDHVNTSPGRFALVYSLRDEAAGRAATHYGVRGGASAIVPVLSVPRPSVTATPRASP